MINNRFFLLALLLGGGAAAVFTIDRHTRHVEKRQQKEDLHNWEHEGGNLAPSATTPAGSV
jgi:hypothetical protein